MQSGRIVAVVAGLQAIATSKRLGAIVEAFDVRPAVKEQVESLGARFVELNVQLDDTQDASGYAKEVSGDTHSKELELIASRLPKVIVATARIHNGNTQSLSSGESLCVKMRAHAANAAALTATDMKPVTGVGAPS